MNGLLLAALCLAAAADGTKAREEAAAPRLSGHAQGVTPPAEARAAPRRAALERGLAFLATQQDLLPDGSFPAGRDETYAPVGVTALCALAFMAAGSTSERGPWRAEAGAAVDYLLSRAAGPEDEHPGYLSDATDRHSHMHGHGLATLALTQAFSMSPATVRGRRLSEVLPAAVRRIGLAQSREGGWYYDPIDVGAHEGSITVCLVQALRAARDAGVAVDGAVIARAIEYVRRLQHENGGFCYALSEPERVSVALTAACLSTLHATGIYRGQEIDRGYDYLWRELAARERAVATGDRRLEARFPYYERFYLMQTLWQHPDERVFEEWYAGELERVLKLQEPDGSWRDERYEGGHLRSRVYGSSYSTAMNCLFLALPDRLLPIFQR